MDLFNQASGSTEGRVPQQRVLPGSFPVSPRNKALYTFSDADLEKLHSRLLKESLCDLVDTRSSGETKKEILAWVMRDTEQPEPFSFKFCCQLEGLDPDEMRALVLRTKRRIERKQLEVDTDNVAVSMDPETEIVETLRDAGERGHGDEAIVPLLELNEDEQAVYVLLDSDEYDGHSVAA